MLLNGTTSTIPLAPAAAAAAAPPLPFSQSSSNFTKSRLSRKTKIMMNRQQQQKQRHRRQDRGDTDGDDEDNDFDHPSTQLHRRQQQRHRSNSFDDTGTALFGKTSFSSHKMKKEEVSNPVAVTPADDRHHQNSLLATFLLHLNSLLPEYCHYLASTSEDTVNAISAAARAIGVLERGADTLYRTFGIATNHDKHNNHGTIPAGGTSSAPSSPLLSQQRKDWSPQMMLTSRHSMWSNNSPTKKKILLTPPQQSTTHVIGGGTMKWNNNAVVETEWERFISPFMNLVGVECLYARMEHVLDPERCNTGRGEGGGTNPKRSERKEKPSVSLFDRLERDSSTSSHRVKFDPPHVLPRPSLLDTGKLGSRRLIATYRQIREDLIVVGEYLCDSVLGSRMGNIPTSSNSSSYAVPTSLSAVPIPPLVSDLASKVKGVDMNFNDRRELAAMSFRETLDALISFIDARCVLIRVHAVLCCQQKSSSHCHSKSGEAGDGYHPMINKYQISDAGDETKKWSALAEQCQHILQALTAVRNKDDDHCIPKRAVTSIEREVRCLELALSSIDKLLQCDLFHCVLSVRKLSVLLDESTHLQSCLPIMFIRSSLPKLLALMHIFFDKDTIQTFPMLTSTPQASMLHQSTVGKKGSLQTKSREKKINFVDLFNEFVRTNSGGMPLAVIVARQIMEPGKQKPSGDDSNFKWKPLYVSSSLCTSSNGPSDRHETVWPFNHWAHIEELLGKHCISVETFDPMKYSINSAVAGDIRGAECCHISSVSNSLCLVVVQSAGSANWQRSTDNAIHQFLRTSTPKLCADNIFSLDVVIRLKSEIFVVNESKSQRGTDKAQPISLWSESSWSSSQQKEALHALGLRRKHSPILAPLRSPYVKRQIRNLGQQRQKKMSNRGHFVFFLGSEIGQLL